MPATYLHPTKKRHLGHNDGLYNADCLEHIARRWAQLYQLVAHFANVCGRNWFSERNAVAFSESVYDVSFARVDKARARARRRVRLTLTSHLFPRLLKCPELRQLAGILPRPCLHP